MLVLSRDNSWETAHWQTGRDTAELQVESAGAAPAGPAAGPTLAVGLLPGAFAGGAAALIHCPLLFDFRHVTTLLLILDKKWGGSGGLGPGAGGVRPGGG